jgi:hypothetical protein
LASDVTCGAKLALTTTTVWTGGIGEPLKRVPKRGGPATLFAVPPSPEAFAIEGTGDTLFFSAGSRLFKMEETATVPSVIASGLLNAASGMLVAGRTLFFIDAHRSKGIPGSQLHRLSF